MNDPPPASFFALFTPDAMAGVVVSVASSLVAAFQAKVTGGGLLLACAAAAILSFVATPVLIARGFSWTDWYGVAAVAIGIASGTAFMLVARVANRALERAPGVADSWIDKFGGPKDKP